MISKYRQRKEKKKRKVERELKELIKMQNKLLAKTKIRRKNNIELYKKNKDYKKKLKKMKELFIGKNDKSKNKYVI